MLKYGEKIGEWRYGVLSVTETGVTSVTVLTPVTIGKS
jgi:hypothetical protein